MVWSYDGDRVRVKTGWDGWSRVYHALEFAVMGRSLERGRRSSLPHLEGVGRVLVLGGGDGRFLEAALASWPGARFVTVDGSAGMLDRSRMRNAAAGAGRCEWFQLEFPSAVEQLPSGPFDGIVTQYFLDCFTDGELAQWWPAVAERLRPGGVWSVVDFAPPECSTGWRQARQRWLLRMLYAAFGCTTSMRARQLPEWEKLFNQADWVAVETGGLERGLFRTGLWRKGLPMKTG